MEPTSTAIAGIINIIAENFWIFFMILAFMCSRQNRIAGYLLLAIQATFGYNKWATIIIVFATLCTNFLNPRKYYKDAYERKLREYQETQNRRRNNIIEMHHENN